jgi:hypothetical protein
MWIVSFHAVFTWSLKSVLLGFGKTFTSIPSIVSSATLLLFLLMVLGSGGQAGSFTSDTLVTLTPQLFTACAVTKPATAVAGYETVMLLLPCPLTNIAPEAPGTVHCTDVELAGVPDNVYVYTLFGQTPVCITSITLGVAGLSFEMGRVRMPLVPQPFVAVTVTEPLVNPFGKVNEMLLLPWPVKPIAFGTGVQVYTFPATLATE